MEIETLQIKRVTANWDKYQNYVPLKGEYVLVDIAGGPKALVLGTSVDGKSGDTLNTLISGKEWSIAFKADTESTIDAKIDELQPTENTQTISGTSSDKGSGDKFAYSNHTHKIEKSTITDVLKDTTNGFEYHGIKASTTAPTSTTPGNVGDIILVYEDK